MSPVKTRRTAPYDKAFLLKLYNDMLRVRYFEERAADCFTKGMLAGNIHLCIGQEASVIGANTALRPTDFITSTHRGHGHLLGKGAKSDRMLAELFGKKTGYCGGKGGSMHAADVSLGILGANGIVGAGIPIATGSAYVSKLRGTDEVTLCFFGDAASNQGTFHESLNMAAAWKLPVVYICENNHYGVSTEIHRVTNTPDLAPRAAAYDVPFAVVDGTDAVAVYEAMVKAMDHARSGKGPYVVEAKVYRYQGHYCGDPAVYRPDEYMEKALENDAIEKMGKRLMDMGVSAGELEAIKKAAADEMNAAVQFAVDSEYPDPSEAVTDVYASDNERCVAR